MSFLSPLFLLGFGVDQFFSTFPLIRGLGNLVWSTSNNATLIAIPFFVLLGEILVRSGIATRTYSALDRWVSWLPGGLVQSRYRVGWPAGSARVSTRAGGGGVSVRPAPRTDPDYGLRSRAWGSWASPSRQTSKWRWGPVVISPVSPESAMVSRARTRSPTRLSRRWLCL